MDAWDLKAAALEALSRCSYIGRKQLRGMPVDAYNPSARATRQRWMKYSCEGGCSAFLAKWKCVSSFFDGCAWLCWTSRSPYATHKYILGTSRPGDRRGTARRTCRPLAWHHQHAGHMSATFGERLVVSDSNHTFCTWAMPTRGDWDRNQESENWRQDMQTQRQR